MKKKIAIALSGGVDSLVAAHLLKESGHEVVGIHFLTGYEQTTGAPGSSSCHFMATIGEQLDIPIHILDCSNEFDTTVVNYFYTVYKNGQTPNPCMVCNPGIKFGTVLKHAFELGASCLATGHYANLRRDSDKKIHLIRGADRQKDQSYFLAFMTQRQLSFALFPLGDLTKSAVRKIAGAYHLRPVLKNESQDICFIRGTTYTQFLSARLGMVGKPGLIEDMNGNTIGNHAGLHYYTIGQRRGINCPSTDPYYVVKLDTKRNRLIVGGKNDLLRTEFNVSDVNWINEAPDHPISAQTRVRYRSQAYDASIIPIDKKTARIRFRRPHPSVAPGQAAVFYKEHEVLGGGWIQPDDEHSSNVDVYH